MKKYTLNPLYYFHNDKDRVNMREIRDNGNEFTRWSSYIHPIQAYILSLFVPKATLDSVAIKLSEIFSISTENARNILLPYVENQKAIYTVFNNQKVIFPPRTLIETDDAKLETPKRNLTVILEDYNLNNINLTPDRLHKAPSSLLFMLTNRCLSRCTYCYADTHTKCFELSFEEIERIVSEAKLLGVDYIDIIGGELFCRNDWAQILTLLVKNDMSPSYISTKVPITKSAAIKLKNSGYSRVVQYSIDSLSDESLTKIIGVRKGYATKLLRSICTLDELDFPIQVNTVLTKWNSSCEEINSLFNMISRIKNITHWEIRVPEKSLYSPVSFEEAKATKRQLEDVFKYIRTNIIPNSTFKIYVSDEALYPEIRKHSTSCTHYPGGICGVLEDRCFILPDGKVSVCEQMYWHNDFIIGDLRKNTLEEIWQSDKAWDIYNRSGYFGHRHKACINCSDSNECLNTHRKCWLKSMKAYGRDQWHYPDPRCINSPVIKENTLSYE